jgi:hypothetical protein
VHTVLREGIDGFLQSRLRQTGASEHAKLTELLERAALTEGEDVRVMPTARRSRSVANI